MYFFFSAAPAALNHLSVAVIMKAACWYALVSSSMTGSGLATENDLKIEEGGLFFSSV